MTKLLQGAPRMTRKNAAGQMAVFGGAIAFIVLLAAAHTDTTSPASGPCLHAGASVVVPLWNLRRANPDMRRYQAAQALRSMAQFMGVSHPVAPGDILDFASFQWAWDYAQDYGSPTDAAAAYAKVCTARGWQD